jgi:hypothetical protein
MKNLILIFAVIPGLLACTSATDKQQQANVDLVKNYVKAVEDMDFAAMETYLGDDYLGMGPSYGDTIRKKEAVENWKNNVAYLYESIHYSRSRFAAVSIPDGDNSGEWVANWAELTIVYKDGRGSATIWANTDYMVENGKIVRSLTFYNEADVLRQLGYRIVPPGISE